MILETFPVGPLQCNCTILGDEAAGEAIVIDPGEEIGRIHRRLQALGLRLKQILITHGHIDHVGGALRLRQLTGAPVLMNEADLEQLDLMDKQAAWLGVATPETAPPDESLTDGRTVGIESYQAKVLHTPGHTQGSVCLHFAPPTCPAAIPPRFSTPSTHVCWPCLTPQTSSPATARQQPSLTSGGATRTCGLAAVYSDPQSA